MFYYLIKSAFKRRWKIAALVILVLLIVRFAFWNPVTQLYRTEMRFIVSTQPLDSTLVTEEEKYYLWIASEYVVASVSDYLNGSDFISLVSDELIARGYEDMDPVTADEFVSTGFERSRLVVAVTHPETDMVNVIAGAAAQVILGSPPTDLVAIEKSVPFNLPIPQFERSPAYLYPIDSELIVNEIDLSAQARREAVSKIFSSLIAGMLVMVVAELRDPTIRGRRSAEKLTLPILAEIPPFES